MSNSIVLDLNSVYDHTTHSESLKNFSYSTKKENKIKYKSEVFHKDTEKNHDNEKNHDHDHEKNHELKGSHGKDKLQGGSGDDHLDGGTDDDDLKGSDGKDYLQGGFGDDLLDGGTGNDDLKGSDGKDYLQGGFGDDLLDGGAGNDDLKGADGKDILTGNSGSDILVGGIGNHILNLGFKDGAKDTVLYAKGDGVDIINQFAKGIDKLGFKGINFIDIKVSGLDTQIRLGNGIAGDAGFGTGTLLETIKGVTGFTATHLGVGGTSVDSSNTAKFFFS